MLSRVVQALIDSLASVDSGATLNTLVLVAHGISGDLQRLEELNIGKCIFLAKISNNA